MTDEWESRRGLTFEQAEGIAPLPAQLQLRQLSPRLRARLWKILVEQLNQCTVAQDFGHAVLRDPWRKILYDKHILYDDCFADDFSPESRYHVGTLREVVEEGSYSDVLGIFQYFLEHSATPAMFPSHVDWALRSSYAAYRVVDRKLIVPFTSEAEAEAVSRTFVDLRTTEFGGARQHLAEASKLLTQGDWAGSVRESIHSAGAVARTLVPGSNTLGPALVALSKGGHVHPALKQGFEKLYGYTNSQEGIRHELLGRSDGDVDETDALYMFGACAAFVSYLIARGRGNGLIK